jgi:hypothetical protein
MAKEKDEFEELLNKVEEDIKKEKELNEPEEGLKNQEEDFKESARQPYINNEVEQAINEIQQEQEEDENIPEEIIEVEERVVLEVIDDDEDEEIIEGIAQEEDQAILPIQQAEEFDPAHPKAELAAIEDDEEKDQKFIIPDDVPLVLKDDENKVMIERMDGTPLFYPENNIIKAVSKKNSVEDYQNMLECLTANYKPPYTLYAPKEDEKIKMQEAVTKFLEKHPEQRENFDLENNPIFTNHKKFVQAGETNAELNEEAKEEAKTVEDNHEEKLSRAEYFETINQDFENLKTEVKEHYSNISETDQITRDDINQEMEQHINSLTNVHEGYMARLSSLDPQHERFNQEIDSYNTKMNELNTKEYGHSEEQLGVKIQPEEKKSEKNKGARAAVIEGSKENLINSIHKIFDNLIVAIKKDYQTQITNDPDKKDAIRARVNNHCSELKKLLDQQIKQLEKLPPNKVKEKLNSVIDTIAKANDAHYNLSETQFGCKIRTELNDAPPVTQPAKSRPHTLSIYADNKAKENAQAAQAPSNQKMNKT